MNKLGRVVPPEGGSKGYAVSGCNSVEEVGVQTGNKKQLLWWTSTRRKQRALLQELL